MKYIRQIDHAIQTKRRTGYKGMNDYFDWVVAEPEQPTGLFGLKVRLYKAYYVLIGKADAFYYERKY